MTIALWSLLGALLLPYAFTTIAKAIHFKRVGKYNNNDPRAFLAGSEGAAKRAHNAQLNTFEALPGFVAGVLVATHVGAPQGLLDGLAILWLALRVLYGIAYIRDWPWFRSIIWGSALTVVCAMFGITLM